MSKKYNLKQSSARLKIDTKTLRRWVNSSNITPSPGDDRRSRMLTNAELESIAKDHRHILEPDPEETNTSHDAHPDLPERKLNQLRAEIRDAKSELNERLNHLTRRLQDQEDKANQEIKTMHQEILVLKSRLEKHLDQH
jgi:DNA anti-recombination protein RmuC